MWLLHFHRSVMEKCPHTTCHLLHSRIYLALVSVFPTGACLQCLTLLGIAFHSYMLAPHHINAPMQCFPCANFLSDDSSLNDSRFKWLDDTCQFTLGLAHLDLRTSLWWRQARSHEVANFCHDLLHVRKYRGHRWTTAVSDKYLCRQILSLTQTHNMQLFNNSCSWYYLWSRRPGYWRRQIF